MVIEDGYIGINESKTVGLNGFGTQWPRYFSYLIIAKISRPNDLMMVVNVHLDPKITLSQE